MLPEKPYMVMFQHQQNLPPPAVTVALSCYRYGSEATEALGSLLQQTEERFDVIVADDCSLDSSLQTLMAWFDVADYKQKFRRALLVQHLANEGLSQSRNTALALVETPYTFILDADNLLYPRALEALATALTNSDCAMAYSLIERFGSERAIVNNEIWSVERLGRGPYVDAMAMVRTAVVRELGGYRVMPNKFGWEDYDLWCKLADHGFTACHVPQILCRYRVHEKSMTTTRTRPFVQQQLNDALADLQAHHQMLFRFG